jgi:hypothetical protein
MRTIELDANGWSDVADFYEAILAALGAPAWHGRNANALLETMIWCQDINAVSPPYCVKVKNVSGAPQGVQDEVRLLQAAILDGRASLRQKAAPDVDVRMETD